MIGLGLRAGLGRTGLGVRAGSGAKAGLGVQLSFKSALINTGLIQQAIVAVSHRTLVIYIAIEC